MPIDINKVKAVVFDMDDLMINSHPVHMDAFEKTMNHFGASFKDPNNSLSKEEEADMFGKKGVDTLKFFHQKYKFSDDVTVEEMSGVLAEFLFPTFHEHVNAMPGVEDLIAFLKEKNYKLAVASSARVKKIDIVLNKFNLEALFDVVVSGEEVQHGKPHPEIFLKAAERLGVEPEECLVLEDAKNGVVAAKAAGTQAIGVHNKFMEIRLGRRQDLSVADLQLEDLNEVKKLFE